MPDFPLFPRQASTIASQVDGVYFGLIVLMVLLIGGIAGALVIFIIRYRHTRSDVDRGNPSENTLKIELTWIGALLVIGTGFCVWAMFVFFDMQRTPQASMDIYAVGKQWMWKFQHPDGKREINTLHVPTDRRVRVYMTSQDVIHSLYFPAFRVKQDVLPGRFTTLWFEATEPGEYHLFCAEYCGTDHSRMRGKVVVMKPSDYEDWMEGAASEQSLASAGEDIFNTKGCAGCHMGQQAAQAPSLEGVFGSEVQLDSGETVVADAQYIRDSILLPEKQLVAGYQPVMPSFQGQLSEDEIIKLIEYIRSLSDEGAGDGADGTDTSQGGASDGGGATDQQGSQNDGPGANP